MRKKKKAPKMVRASKKPFTLVGVIAGKVLYRVNVKQKKLGLNPFDFY